MKHQIRTLIEHADNQLHRIGWTPQWLCQLADLSYGVPIDSFGHPDEPPDQRMACRTARVLWKLIGEEHEWEIVYDAHGWFFVVDIHGEALFKSHDRVDAERVKAELEADGEEVGLVHIRSKDAPN